MSPVKLPTVKSIDVGEVTEDSIELFFKPVEHAIGYDVYYRDIIEGSWEDAKMINIDSKERSVVITGLYPTATFEIKIIAKGDMEQYEDSDESEIIDVDTLVGGCTPKEKSCCSIM
ncbi:hypothetical protein WA158_002160 [Blastocystis sp. Blastoise]